jgi:hypothetical protein
MMRRSLVVALAALVAACSTTPRREPFPSSPAGAPESAAPAPVPAPKREAASTLPAAPLLAADTVPAWDEGRLRVPAEEDTLEFFKSMPLGPGPRHVHLMHLDGFRADLFRALLEGGQLPNFLFLLQRGKVSYRASTVDKSETMKVIESYLTSRRDTTVTGWWQFDRDQFQFRNFWLDPVEVVNYAIGLEFPLSPTVFDVVAAKAGPQAVTAGFSLHRRSVPFRNYARAYVEGGTSAFKHTYFDQAHATMSRTIAVLERIAREGGKAPLFSTSLLACADEFAHLQGVVAPGPEEFCVVRKEKDKERKTDRMERLFRIVDEDRERLRGLLVQGIRDGRPVGNGYFTRVRWSRSGERGESRELCIRRPRLEVHGESLPAGAATTIGRATYELAHPNYVLGMILIDYELGRLIDAYRGVRVDARGKASWVEGFEKGILPYIRARRAEGSLLENTLFVLTGDHGMVDSKYKMARVDPAHPDLGERRPASLNQSLIEDLNPRLALATARGGANPAPRHEIGIDDALIPARLAFPHKFPEWQSPEIRRVTADAVAWAQGFFEDVKGAIRDSARRQYWWLFFLRRFIVDPRVNSGLDPHANQAVDVLAKLYLKAVPAYRKAELEANRRFYDEHVRFIYGGAARNNVEIFLPATVDGRASWSRRPTYDEVLAARGGARSTKTVLEALFANPGVALLFIRRENGAISASAPLPETMEIDVRDRAGNRATISVRKGAGEPVYGYRVDEGTADPLGYYEGERRGRWHYGTYAEWNDFSVREKHYYHNAVAGMGSYLYSSNPSIGDITGMHAQGWNFGDNSGGHGGIHREEKLTVMMVAGPGIARGELLARATRRARVGADGTPSVVDEEAPAYPTVVDAAPTLLRWLGLGDRALSDFARDGFAEHLRAWVSAERRACADNAMALIADAIDGADLGIDFSDRFQEKLRLRFARLCEGLPAGPPRLPDFRDFREDGNLLDLAH